MNKELKKEDINLAEWEFEFKQRNAHPPLMADWWLVGIRQHFAAEIKLPEWHCDYLITSEHKGYIKTAQKRAMLDSLRSRVADREYRHYIFEGTQRMSENLQSQAKSIMERFSPELSNTELYALWQEVEESVHRALPWFWVPYYVSEQNMLSDKVHEGLERHRAAVEEITDIDTALVLLITPVKEPSFIEEQRHFGELVTLAQQDSAFETAPQFVASAKSYLAKYDWMGTFFVAPLEPLGMDELIARVRAAAHRNIQEELAVQAKHKSEQWQQVQALESVCASDPVLMEYIEDARELGWILTASVEGALFATAKYIPIYKHLAKVLGLSYEQFTLLTSGEIYDGLQGQMINASALVERAEGYVACLQNNGISWLWGAQGRELAQALNDKERVAADITELKGRVGYKGKATARACVAVTAAEANAMADGEVLVTIMTTPDYVPAMKRAGAIVTDEGGMLSHAAIMSREFKKPCVIATKFATQVLKTGDMVEVDADTGIVKKL